MVLRYYHRICPTQLCQQSNN